jgi:hypothetical protein
MTVTFLSILISFVLRPLRWVVAAVACGCRGSDGRPYTSGAKELQRIRKRRLSAAWFFVTTIYSIVNRIRGLTLAQGSLSKRVPRQKKPRRAAFVAAACGTVACSRHFRFAHFKPCDKMEKWQS